MGENDRGRASETRAYETVRRDGVLRVRRPGTEWLSTGWNGGRSRSPSAYNVSVPEGWACDDVGAYVDDRLARAGFDRDGSAGDSEGPVLLTGVDLDHARGARLGSVVVYATAGISNPAALPMDPSGGELPDGRLVDENAAPDGDRDGNGSSAEGSGRPVGTVNLLVGTTRALADGALANLIAVAAEAKATTLLAATGFPGTTTDAIVVGHDPAGSPVEFSGSATAVGAAARACVREAVSASLRSRYEGTDATIPDSIADATYGVSTDARATVFRPQSTEPE